MVCGVIALISLLVFRYLLEGCFWDSIMKFIRTAMGSAIMTEVTNVAVIYVFWLYTKHLVKLAASLVTSMLVMVVYSSWAKVGIWATAMEVTLGAAVFVFGNVAVCQVYLAGSVWRRHSALSVCWGTLVSVLRFRSHFVARAHPTHRHQWTQRRTKWSTAAVVVVIVYLYRDCGVDMTFDCKCHHQVVESRFGHLNTHSKLAALGCMIWRGMLNWIQFWLQGGNQKDEWAFSSHSFLIFNFSNSFIHRCCLMSKLEWILPLTHHCQNGLK